MIQFQNRNSKAPALRMPCRPRLAIASTGITVVSSGASAMAIACCVPPTYEVPSMPIRPLDQACRPIQAAQSTPSGPSSVSMCQTPSDP